MYYANIPRILSSSCNGLVKIISTKNPEVVCVTAKNYYLPFWFFFFVYQEELCHCNSRRVQITTWLKYNTTKPMLSCNYCNETFMVQLRSTIH